MKAFMFGTVIAGGIIEAQHHGYSVDFCNAAGHGLQKLTTVMHIMTKKKKKEKKNHQEYVQVLSKGTV